MVSRQIITASYKLFLRDLMQCNAMMCMLTCSSGGRIRIRTTEEVRGMPVEEEAAGAIEVEAWVVVVEVHSLCPRP